MLTHACAALCALVAALGPVASSAAGQDASRGPDAGRTAPAWVTPAVPAPRVSFHTFDSPAAQAKVSYHLYTPAAYARDDRARFPVVYWLHGSGGGIAGIPQLARLFDDAIEAGKAPPFLVVFVNGLVEGMYVDWKDGSAPVESMIVKDLVPHIDATLRTVATRDGRLLDGFSMGGYGAARLGFKFPQLFRAVSMLGAGPLDPDFERTPRANPRARDGLLTRVYGDRAHFRAVSPWEIAAQNAATIAAGSMVRIAVGDRDGTFALNEEFHRHLDGLNIPHEWIVLKGIEHDPMRTLDALGERNWEFYRRAFGKGATSVARTDGEIAIEAGGADRRAIVANVPPPGQTRPAVLILHGGMGNADAMRRRAGFDALARTEGFMAVYPEGTDYGGGRYAWNTGFLLRRQVGEADDIAYFDTLIDTLVRDYGADRSRIYMTGGSNGGMMTFVYAVARAQRLAAVAPVVASMFTLEQSPAVPLPILIINGAKDEEVPIEGGMSRNQLVRRAQTAAYKPVQDVVDFWVRANKSVRPGVTSTAGTVTTTTYAAGDGGAVTEQVVDSAGGHGWPGAPQRREGNSPIMAFSGAERVWKFFADKSRARGVTKAAAPMPGASAAATPVPLKVDVIEFPELVDPTRPGIAPGVPQPKEPAGPGRSPGAGGRRVPIKVHVPAGGGPYPVVVASHGAGGSWDTHFAQAQHLAAHGYAVLCIEHVGSNRERLMQGFRPMRNIEAMTRDADEVLTRPKDVAFAIDRAAEWNGGHERLKGRLDLSRVGAMGHSYGAYTTMAACGMRPALDWLEPAVAPGKGLGPDLFDPRVRCGVALSPQGAGEPFFIPESFASLRVPLMGISGSRDIQQAGRTAEDRKAAFALWPKGDHRLLWLSNANHLDFSDSSGSDDRALPSSTRADVQPVVRAATLAFFDLHLKSDPSSAQRLTPSALAPFLRGSIDSVDVLTK